MWSLQPWGAAVPAPRKLVATAMVCVWALRLGSHLFVRVLRDGHDSRFDGIRERPLRFINLWTIQVAPPRQTLTNHLPTKALVHKASRHPTQALWALLTALPVYTANAVAHQPPLGAVDAAGAALWCVGLALEAAADAQKKAWRKLQSNRGKWIDTGLWAWSRHPNYLGEMLLWVGAVTQPREQLMPEYRRAVRRKIFVVRAWALPVPVSGYIGLRRACFPSALDS